TGPDRLHQALRVSGQFVTVRCGQAIVGLDARRQSSGVHHHAHRWSGGHARQVYHRHRDHVLGITPPHQQVASGRDQLRADQLGAERAPQDRLYVLLQARLHADFTLQLAEQPRGPLNPRVDLEERDLVVPYRHIGAEDAAVSDLAEPLTDDGGVLVRRHNRGLVHVRTAEVAAAVGAEATAQLLDAADLQRRREQPDTVDVDDTGDVDGG